MRILAIAWILVVVTWCCDSAVIYEPVVQNTRYYEPRIQDLELLDVSPLSYFIVRTTAAVILNTISAKFSIAVEIVGLKLVHECTCNIIKYTYLLTHMGYR